MCWGHLIEKNVLKIEYAGTNISPLWKVKMKGLRTWKVSLWTEEAGANFHPSFSNIKTRKRRLSTQTLNSHKRARKRQFVLDVTRQNTYNCMSEFCLYGCHS
jgi:hypothetical protein